MLAPSQPSVAIAEGDHDYDHLGHIEQLVEDCLDELDPPDELLTPGDNVFIKPNWALELADDLPEGEDPRAGWECKITHPAIIEATARWAAKQLNGNGSITIADAPWVETPFSVIDEITGLSSLPARCAADFPGVSFQLADFRGKGGTTQVGDPAGYAKIALAEASEFQGVRLPKAFAEAGAAYQLSRTALDADVLINLPKLKTHNKTGLAGALNNVITLLDDRAPLPMNPLAADEDDEEEEEDLDDRLFSWLRRKFKHSRMFLRFLLRSRQALNENDEPPEKHESWHGNDLFWRLVLDVNTALTYYNDQSHHRAKPLRTLHLVDAVIAGEGNGPLLPDPKPTGLLLAGTNPLAVDCTAATLMGFDWHKIRLLHNAFADRKFPLAEFQPEAITCLSENESWNGPLAELTDPVDFHPHDGWWGEIEKQEPEDA